MLSLANAVRFATFAAALAGCNVFDASLYLNRADASDSDVDAGLPDTGPRFPIADRCEAALPTASSSSEPLSVSTLGLRDDFSQVATCTGSDERGNDGFFGVDMLMGERWHFHVRSNGAVVNPAVYILRSCDERSCMPGDGLDECGSERDEHITFIAPSTGRFIVGIDSRDTGGAAMEVIALRPVCGNGGVPEHSETCDDGNTLSGDGCDSRCRSELRTSGTSEAEPNDDSFSANVLPATSLPRNFVVRARLGGRCDYDMFVFDVPANGSVRATLLDNTGAPCPAGFAALRLALIAPDARTERGLGVVATGNACPAIGAAQAFAQNLPEGQYFLRTTLAGSDSTALDYQLRVEVMN